MYTPMLKNHINGCHGNHAFFIVQTNFSLITKNICNFGVPMNDLAPMKKCPEGARWVKYAPVVPRCFSSFSVIFHVFINIHENAN